MSLFRAVSASLPGSAMVLGLLLGPAFAQTANGSPTDPASPSLPGTPRSISRTAPSTGPRHVSPTATLPDGKMKPPPKPTAAERADQKKLEHDLHICIGC